MLQTSFSLNTIFLSSGKRRELFASFFPLLLLGFPCSAPSLVILLVSFTMKWARISWMQASMNFLSNGWLKDTILSLLFRLPLLLPTKNSIFASCKWQFMSVFCVPNCNKSWVLYMYSAEKWASWKQAKNKAKMHSGHGVWKLQKKSHSTLRAKRVTFTFWVDNS